MAVDDINKYNDIINDLLIYKSLLAFLLSFSPLENSKNIDGFCES